MNTFTAGLVVLGEEEADRNPRGLAMDAAAAAAMSSVDEAAAVMASGDGAGIDDDDDTEMVRTKPARPNLQWKDEGFQASTMAALKQMRKDRHFCDVTLQIGQHDVAAHRLVLAVASPYFMELFTSSEDRPTRSEVRRDGGIVYELNGGFQKKALEYLVDYAYTARLDIPGDEVKAVYMAALRLRMDRVVKKCERFLLSQLDLASCLDIRSMPGVAPKAGCCKAPDAPQEDHLTDCGGGPGGGVANGDQQQQQQVRPKPSHLPVEPADGQARSTADLPEGTPLSSSNGGDGPLAAKAEESVDLVSKVDDFIEANLEKLWEGRELMSLPRICLEILHLSKEEREAARARPLCEMVLDWVRGQWLEDEDLTVEKLASKRHLLYVGLNNSMQDCDSIEEGSANDSEFVQDYKKVNQHLTQTFARKQRRHVADAAPTASSVKPAKPRELLYSRHINQDDHAKQADFNDGWKVIACRKLDDKSVLAIVSIERNLATFSIIQKVNKASSAASAKGAPDAAAAAAANVEGAVVAVAAAPSAELMGASSGATASSPGPAAAEKDLKVLLPMMRASRSPKISRNASFEKQMVFTSVAAMKDGKSGLGAGSFQGKLLVCGGFDRGECMNKVDAYDEVTNKWSKMKPMLEKRGRFDLTVVGDNTIYAIAGSNGYNEVKSVEKYDSAMEKWTPVISLPLPISNMGVCNLNGKVYCIGGTNGSSGTKCCFRLNEAENSWDRICNLQTGRSQAATGVFMGKIWVVGGSDSWNSLKSVEIYDPASDSWKYGPPLSTPRRGSGLAVIKDQLIVVGGSDGTHPLCTTEVFSPEEGTWRPGPTMTNCRVNAGVTAVGDKLWAVGGFSGKVFLNNMEYLDLEANEWTNFLPIPADLLPQDRDDRWEGRSVSSSGSVTAEDNDCVFPKAASTTTEQKAPEVSAVVGTSESGPEEFEALSQPLDKKVDMDGDAEAQAEDVKQETGTEVIEPKMEAVKATIEATEATIEAVEATLEAAEATIEAFEETLEAAEPQTKALQNEVD